MNHVPCVKHKMKLKINLICPRLLENYCIYRRVWFVEMVWKETLMAMTADWGFCKKREPKEKFECGFVSRLNERCELHYKNPKWLFTYLFQHLNERFPKHFLFANFQCLRCGELCGEAKDVYREDVKRWMIELRFDILEHVDCWSKRGFCIGLSDLFEPCDGCKGGELVTFSKNWKCPFLRKVRNKPYYECRIHETTIEECRGYLCEKSVPVAHLNWIDVDDLIGRIGLEQYRLLRARKRS